MAYVNINSEYGVLGVGNLSASGATSWISVKICAQTLRATCGGSVAMAFAGTVIGVAVKSEYCGFAWRRVL